MSSKKQSITPTQSARANSQKVTSGKRRLTSSATNNQSNENSAIFPGLLNSYEATIESLIDYNAYLMPEWSDADVQGEKWITKHAYEEPEPFTELPANLKSQISGYKRINELFPVSVNESNSCIVTAATLSASTDGDSFTTCLEVIRNEEEKKISGQSILSNFMRTLMAKLSLAVDLYKSRKSGVLNMDDPAPWDAIYPKGKDGLPMYNASGKYIIKLYDHGCWRKVTVDDKMPFNQENKLLLPVSANANEYWTLILCKAICKVVFADDVDVSQLIHGYVPQSLKWTLKNNFDEIAFQSQKATSKATSAASRDSKGVEKNVKTTDMIYVLSCDNDETIMARITDVRFIEDDPTLKKEIKIKPFCVGGNLNILDKISGFYDNFNDLTGNEKIGSEIWLSVDNAIKIFNLKFIESVEDINANFPIPFVIYSENPINILIQVTSCGRLKYPASCILEEFDWKRNNQKRIQTIPICFNGFNVSIPNGIPIILKIDIPCGYFINVWSKDNFIIDEFPNFLKQKQQGFVIDSINSFPAQPSNSFFYFFRHKINLSKDATFYGQLLLSNPFLRHYSSISVINLDNQEIIFSDCLNKSFILESNKNGYLLSAFCRTTLNSTQSKYRFILISDNQIIPVDQISTFQFQANFNTIELDEIYIPNKHHTITKQFLKLKEICDCQASIFVGFSQQVEMKLSLIKNGNILKSFSGRGFIYIPLITLWNEQDNLNDDSRSKISLLLTGNENDMIHHVLIPFNSSYQAPDFISLVNKKKNTSGLSADPKKKAKDKPTGNESQSSNEQSSDLPCLKIKIFYPENISISMTKDTETEDKYKQLKSSWESAQPGRALKAKEARESYLKSLSKHPLNKQDSRQLLVNEETSHSNFNLASIRTIIEKEPLEFMPLKRRHQLWKTLSAPYAIDNLSLIKNQWYSEKSDSITEIIEKSKENFKLFQDNLSQSRRDEFQSRLNWSAMHTERINKTFENWKVLKNEDNARREEYRQNVIKVLQQQAAMNVNEEKPQSAKKDKGNAKKSPVKK
ncbi:hypothetical protein O9G_004553 [Rozella allomycis CSF55]|uniref:Calpain catalytic domain-containing protein n=1 Tax=Rozella allomycis (strain CSF55) TaxID=988480 RepID=A0A075AQS7_ROZAC|nr:hypothetical protein O9G_004553 [Rozella allomycis CSF55]|eukprot:EPZ32601.1 hypothetical protein O9G_004553 [Rozella allomycis CSF55]